MLEPPSHVHEFLPVLLPPVMNIVSRARSARWGRGVDDYRPLWLFTRARARGGASCTVIDCCAHRAGSEVLGGMQLDDRDEQIYFNVNVSKCGDINQTAEHAIADGRFRTFKLALAHRRQNGARLVKKEITSPGMHPDESQHLSSPRVRRSAWLRSFKVAQTV